MEADGQSRVLPGQFDRMSRGITGDDEAAAREHAPPVRRDNGLVDLLGGPEIVAAENRSDSIHHTPKPSLQYPRRLRRFRPVPARIAFVWP